MTRMIRQARQFLRGHDKAYLAVNFLLALPVLLLLLGIIVQWALLANAQLTLDRAVQVGARSAMTSLPVDPALGEAGGPAFVARSVRMTLESISPAGTDTSTEGEDVANALTALGTKLRPRYAERYAYAEQATEVMIEPYDNVGGLSMGADYSKMKAPRVRLTVTYDYKLPVPLWNMVFGRKDTVDGLTGRFRRLTSSMLVQLSPGREGGWDMGVTP